MEIITWMVRLAILSSLLLVAGFIPGWSQPPPSHPLEKIITIEFKADKISTVLSSLENAGGFTFSYHAALIPKDKLFTGSYQQATIREILEELFDQRVDYKTRGRYIILTRRTPEIQVVQGYIIDEKTGQRLKNVSVYDPVSLRSSITDDYGFFRIDIDNPTSEDVKLAIVKKNYADTTIQVMRSSRRMINIPIQLDGRRVMVLGDSIGFQLKKFFTSTWKSTEQAINMENINDTLYRTYQTSILPFIGSNGKLSGNVINRYSINFIGGYSLGNEVLEVGGLFNAERGDVKGFQLAGLANGVLGNVTAIQFAGLTNLTGGNQSGFQAAGLMNFNYRNSQGVKFAGITNFTLGQSEDYQAAGILNVSFKDQTGGSIAGLANITIGSSRHFQLAGLLNFTGSDFCGIQTAGLFNFAGKDVTGVQVAGLFNFGGRKVSGIQLSTLLNYSGKLEGTSIALFNIVRDTASGIPIGLMSIVKKGYTTIELSADETFQNMIALRSGVRRFYNMIYVGARPQTYNDTTTTWTFGYGLGTSPQIGKKLFLNLDASTGQVVAGGRIDGLNLITKFYTGLEFQISRNLALTAGVTLNLQIIDKTIQSPELFSFYKPTFRELDQATGLNSLRGWVGGKIGIRIF